MFGDFNDEFFGDYKKVIDEIDGMFKGKDNYSYYKSERRVDGELVSKDEEEWKNGECVKDEHYRSDKALGCSCTCDKKCDDKSESCNKPKIEVEYNVEVDDAEELQKENERLKDKVSSLRKCVKSLSCDAEKDHKKIKELENKNKTLKELLSKLSDGLKGVTGVLDEINN